MWDDSNPLCDTTHTPQTWGLFLAKFQLLYWILSKASKQWRLSEGVNSQKKEFQGFFPKHLKKNLDLKKHLLKDEK